MSLIAHSLSEKERTEDVLLTEEVSFNALLLSEDVFKGLTKNGFVKPSPIQLKAIPLGKCGFDLIIQSKSGTGKTAVFAIIALEMIDLTRDDLQVLIVAPTREIAVQIQSVTQAIGSEKEGLKVEVFIGGLPIEDNIQKAKGCHIAVGTPGRLKKLIEDEHLKVNTCRLFVLDEADKLLESSLQADINFMYHKLPKRKQTLALSATYNEKLQDFLSRYMRSPTYVSPSANKALLLGLKQFIYEAKSNLNVVQQMNLKTAALVDILSHVSFTQCLVFSNYQLRVENLHNSLKKQGWTSTYISGAQKQTDRLKALSDLKEFKCRILLSTDLTSRGIDAANVDLVINYDIPTDASVYLHRMGRAGRYGSKGVCINIATVKEMASLQSLLGEIGGAGMSIQVLPTDKLPSDLWSAQEDMFKVIYATANQGKSTQVSKSVWELKLESEEEKSNKKDITDNVKIMLNKNNKELKKIEENLKDVDPESLLQSLAAGKLPIQIGEIEDKTELVAEECFKLLDDNQDFDESMECESKLKEKKRKRAVNVSKKSKAKHADKNEVDENFVLTNNIGVLNLGRLLVDNDSLEIPDDVRETTQDMLHRANQDFVNISQSVNQSNTSDILQDLSELSINNKNPKINESNKNYFHFNKNDIQYPEFNIFKLAYEGTLEQTNLDWGEFVDFPLVRDRYKYGKDISCPWITYWPSKKFDQKQKPKKSDNDDIQDDTYQNYTEPSQQDSVQTNNVQQNIPLLNNLPQGNSLPQQNIIPTYFTQTCYPNQVAYQSYIKQPIPLSVNSQQNTTYQTYAPVNATLQTYPTQQNTVVTQNVPQNATIRFHQNTVVSKSVPQNATIQTYPSQQNLVNPQNIPHNMSVPSNSSQTTVFVTSCPQIPNTIMQQYQVPNSSIQPNYGQQNILQSNYVLRSNLQPNMLQPNLPLQNIPQQNSLQSNFPQQTVPRLNNPQIIFSQTQPQQTSLPPNLSQQIYGQQNNMQIVNSPLNNLQTINPIQNNMQPVNPPLNTLQTINPILNNVQTINPPFNNLQSINPTQNIIQPINPVNNLQSINPIQHNMQNPSLNNLQFANPIQNNMQPVNPALNNLQFTNPIQNNMLLVNPLLNNLQSTNSVQYNMQSANSALNNLQSTNPVQNSMQPANPPLNNLKSTNPIQNIMQPVNPPLNNLQSINSIQNNMQSANAPQTNIELVYPPQLHPQQNNIIPNQPPQNMVQPNSSQVFYSQPNTILPPISQINRTKTKLSQQSTSQTLTLRSPSLNGEQLCQSSSDMKVEAVDKDYQYYFDYYGECLKIAETSFYDAPSFAEWFDDWQKRLEQVRNFVQKTIYLHSMTNED